MPRPQPRLNDPANARLRLVRARRGFEELRHRFEAPTMAERMAAAGT